MLRYRDFIYKKFGLRYLVLLTCIMLKNCHCANMCTTWRRMVIFTPRPLISDEWYHGNCLVWGWVGLGAGLDATAKSKIPATVGHRTSVSQPIAFSLYWLSYPDVYHVTFLKYTSS